MKYYRTPISKRVVHPHGFYEKRGSRRGEAISFTAIPRTEGAKIGTMHHINVTNVTGKAENSVRVWGSAGSRVHDVVLDRVNVTIDRWTKYPGGVYDNRPTKAVEALPKSATAGFSIQDADNVVLRDCTLVWGEHRPMPAGKDVEDTRVTGLKVERFVSQQIVRPKVVNE